MLLWQSFAPVAILAGLVALLLNARLLESAFIRAFVCILAGLLLVRYLAWRTLFTLPEMDFSFGSIWAMIFYIAELFSIVSSLLALVILSRTSNRTDEATRNQGWLLTELPSIDVFIATYNEEKAILERTIIGAKSQEYPRFRVFVLDDGERPWLKEFCDELDVNYITRTTHAHAKSGNMNNAVDILLKDGSLGDFIAVLDADFVAQPNFLVRAASLFRDPSVGIVQTPQHFFNPDPLQHTFAAGGIMPDEQRFFFDVVLPSKDAWDVAFCCGTSSLCRREALLDVGGFPVESITEDMLLTFKMKVKGWRTVYLNEKLSAGLAPEGLSEYITQRGRWCIGFMQIFRGPWGLFARNGLGLADRISLLDSFLFWTGTYIFRLLCLLVPIVYWLTGATVIRSNLADIVYYLLPSILCQIVALAWISRGRILPILTDASQVLVSIDLIKAAAIGLLRPKNQKFKVTDKGGDRSKIRVHWHLLRRFTVLMALLIAGMGLAYIDNRITFDDSSAIVSLFWSYYTFIVLSISMMTCIELPREKDELFDCDETAKLITETGSYAVRITEISLSTVCVEKFEHAAPVMCGLRIEGVGGIVPARTASTGRHPIRIELSPSREQKWQLIRKIFSGRYGAKPDDLMPGAIYLKMAMGFFRS